ncbi:hypothetical protein [Altererythrobacter sp. B11]|nr:hypothetical protein [Altererythrobacter sp. B11]
MAGFLGAGEGRSSRYAIAVLIASTNLLIELGVMRRLISLFE